MFSTAYARSVRRLPARVREDAPLVDCIVNDALVDVMPHLLQTLFQFVSVVHPRLVHSLLDDAPDSVLNRLFAGQRSRGMNAGVDREVAQCRVPVCWGVVLLKDEKFS